MFHPPERHSVKAARVRRVRISVPGASFTAMGPCHDSRGEQNRVVKIRLQKLGRRNKAYFRIVVTDARVKRQGTYLEKLGQYDPIETDKEKQLLVNTDRVKHWVAQGAQATEAVVNLLRKRGLNLNDKPTPKKEKKAAPAKK